MATEPTDPPAVLGGRRQRVDSVPEQRRRPDERSPAFIPVEQPVAAPRPIDGSGRAATTLVLPYVGSPRARRTRSLRAWMPTMPVDLVAVLAPLVWNQTYWKGMLFTGLLTVVVFATSGFYRSRRHLSILDLLPSLLGRLLLVAGMVAMVAAVRHESVDYVFGFLRSMIFSAVLVVLGRAATTLAVQIARRRRWVERGAIIIGGGAIASELARLLRRYPQYGLRFVGFVDEAGAEHNAVELMPLIGTLEQLEELVVAVDCDVIIVADTNGSESLLMELVRQPSCMRRDLWVVPRLRNFHSQGTRPDHIGAIPVVQLRRPTLTGPRWALKRASDITFASLALLLVSPVLALCALAVRVESGPGVLFRQRRVGRFGRPFDLLKFRSLRPLDETESQTNWSVAHDSRIGPVGRFLRRTSLDELPQLWNILRGDMTLVGPRPERPYFVEKFSSEHPSYALRHRAPSGLTGLAQVSGLRGDTPISDRARFDNYYIDNWSLWLDVKVLIRTVAEVFRAGGR
jgi:exopolysaccharide biosynthesis polyprenyl glycosylphosphotransferase